MFRFSASVQSSQVMGKSLMKLHPQAIRYRSVCDWFMEMRHVTSALSVREAFRVLHLDLLPTKRTTDMKGCIGDGPSSCPNPKPAGDRMGAVAGLLVVGCSWVSSGLSGAIGVRGGCAHK